MQEVGIGGRVINFFVDTLLVFLISYGFYKWYSFYVMYWQFKFFPFYLFFYSTVFVYYTLSEALFSRTIGKIFSLSKVRNFNDKRPSFLQVVLRSLLRLTLIDMFFIPFLGRPLHDHLSKTRVVEA